MSTSLLQREPETAEDVYECTSEDPEIEHSNVEPDIETDKEKVLVDYPAKEKRKIKLPQRFQVYEIHFTQINISNSYEEAMLSSDRKQWELSIKEELEALERNKTWDISELPNGKQAIKSKWVF
ncbi:unnamed protein product [Arctia plantaginis]|uniref:Reverse transcriptase n=1 Tax=Arctia plantaginis TaxID=874455 RepID=A0A8S1B0K2_ARCPL|nr:unnamed protein product [Arctia plantaginis]